MTVEEVQPNNAVPVEQQEQEIVPPVEGKDNSLDSVMLG
jgi:hypothetical protein